MSQKTIAQPTPQVAALLREEGRQQERARQADERAADRAEAARIAGLEAVAVPGYEDLLAAAKADGKSTGPELAVQIVRALKDRRGAEPGSALAIGFDKARYASNPSLHREFGTEANYLAYCAGIRSGTIRSVTPPAQVARETTQEDEIADLARFKSDASLRRDFETAGAYLRYCAAVRAGRITGVTL